MKISLFYYIRCVLLFQYSIAAPPGPYLGPNDDLPVNLNFPRRTDGGSIIDHSGWKPPADPHHSASQGQSLPGLSRQSAVHPNFTTLRLPPIQHDPSQAGPQGGSGHSYGYGPASPPQQQAPPHHPSFPNQQFDGSRQQVNPPSHLGTSSQAGPSQAQQQQAQAHSSRRRHITMGHCRMCNASYVQHSKPSELRQHMLTVGHITPLDTGPHTAKTRM